MRIPLVADHLKRRNAAIIGGILIALLSMVTGVVYVWAPWQASVMRENAIQKENRLPGNAGLLPPRTAEEEEEKEEEERLEHSVASDKGGSARVSAWTDTAIRGYAGATSINVGQSVKLYVSTAESTFDLQIYRIGWYNGVGSRLITTIPNLTGQNQPVPAPQAGTGLIEANWQPTYTLQTDSSWTTGVYFLKMVAASGASGYIPLIIRNDSATADILYQIAVTTYQAYNNWGGKSLYEFNSTNGRAYKVSFDRPYGGNGTSTFFDGDVNMVRWLESKGYNVSYATSVDTESNPNLLNNRKVFLSNYHDEYWSRPMRTNLERFISQGKHVAFFDANNIYWQIRFESSTGGVSNRVITCYKDATLDPKRSIDPKLTTVNWRDAPVSEPENAVLGGMFISLVDYGQSAPWVVSNSQHWIYTGTGLKDGDTIPELVGYEFDKVWNNGKTPAGLTVLSNSPIVDSNGDAAVANASIYTAPSGAIVFNAGTIYWSWKLDDNAYLNHGMDIRVRQMTANLLDKMITGVTPNPTPTVGTTPTVALTVTPTQTPTPTPTLTPTATPASSSYSVYNEGLENGWEDWSWGSSNKVKDTHPYAGSYNFSWTALNDSSGINFHSRTGVNTTPYKSLTFAAQATATGAVLSIVLVDENDNWINSTAYLTSYGGNPVVGSYKIYTIPLTSLGGANKLIKGIQIKNRSGAAQPAMYIDKVEFVV